MNRPNEDLTDNNWWKKIDPIALDFIYFIIFMLRPRSTLFINKELIIAKGRTKYTL